MELLPSDLLCTVNSSAHFQDGFRLLGIVLGMSAWGPLLGCCRGTGTTEEAGERGAPFEPLDFARWEGDTPL